MDRAAAIREDQSRKTELVIEPRRKPRIANKNKDMQYKFKGILVGIFQYSDSIFTFFLRYVAKFTVVLMFGLVATQGHCDFFDAGYGDEETPTLYHLIGKDPSKAQASALDDEALQGLMEKRHVLRDQHKSISYDDTTFDIEGSDQKASEQLKEWKGKFDKLLEQGRLHRIEKGKRHKGPEPSSMPRIENCIEKDFIRRSFDGYLTQFSGRAKTARFRVRTRSSSDFARSLDEAIKGKKTTDTDPESPSRSRSNSIYVDEEKESTSHKKGKHSPKLDSGFHKITVLPMEQTPEGISKALEGLNKFTNLESVKSSCAQLKAGLSKLSPAAGDSRRTEKLGYLWELHQRLLSLKIEAFGRVSKSLEHFAKGKGKMNEAEARKEKSHLYSMLRDFFGITKLYYQNGVDLSENDEEAYQYDLNLKRMHDGTIPSGVDVKFPTYPIQHNDKFEGFKDPEDYPERQNFPFCHDVIGIYFEKLEHHCEQKIKELNSGGGKI